jgi:hypothetical protein
VRHVRMLGLCLVAVFALGAMTAGQAMAKKEACIQYGTACETLKEHATFQAYANCPFGATEIVFCTNAKSYYKETFKTKAEEESTNKAAEEAYKESEVPFHAGQLSYFTAGKVTVPLKGSITLQGGLKPSGTVNVFNFIAPTNGVPAIEPVKQPSIPLTKGVNKSLLSQSELERYDYWTRVVKEIKTYATVELAGPVERLQINLGAIIGEHGDAFVFPVKVKLSNPFLGEHCYVGSEE